MQERTNRGFGWRPDIPDFRDKLYRASKDTAVALAPALLIPDSRLPPVFDQGQTSSCVGNSTSVMATYVTKQIVRSRLFIYFEARRLIGETKSDEGCYIRDGIKVLANIGAPSEKTWAFNTKNVLLEPNAASTQEASTHKVAKYMRLQSRQDFRSCIAEGYPFVTGFTVYNNFMSDQVANTGVLQLPNASEKMQGGHAICVVGYDSNFKKSRWGVWARNKGLPDSQIPNDVYLIRNSWGSEWGYHGNFAIDAKYLENPNMSDDAWTIRNS